MHGRRPSEEAQWVNLRSNQRSFPGVPQGREDLPLAVTQARISGALGLFKHPTQRDQGISVRSGSCGDAAPRRQAA